MTTIAGPRAVPPRFTSDEYERRQQAACAAMAATGLDGMLLFKQESMYWLTGYDSFGFCFFQCLVLRADGRMALLTRAPDLRQAQHTSIIEDIRIWADAEGVNPALALRPLLGELQLEG
jgi:Xaa-Pro dipeptidase